jgi:arylsulfatase A-like enzyme
MDHHIGRLIGYLEEKGILDQALLVLTSDHGENLGDAPGPVFDHGWTVYQNEAAAVCIIRLLEAARGGTRYTSLAASVDILPTILSYLNMRLAPDIEGDPVDLEHTAFPARPPVRFCEASKPWEEVETDKRWYNILKPRCVRRESLKYVRTEHLGTEELYDLADDPDERSNLLTDSRWQRADATLDLRRALHAWSNSAKPLATSFESKQRTDTIRRLRSLGYISPGTSDRAETEDR